MSREVIYINNDPIKPSYYTLEPIKNQQGEWKLAYVPQSQLEELKKINYEMVDKFSQENDELKRQLDNAKKELEELRKLQPTTKIEETI